MFTDVPEGYPGQEAMETMRRLGIMKGVPQADGTVKFEPERAVKRRELAQVLFNLNIGAAMNGWRATAESMPASSTSPTDKDSG